MATSRKMQGALGMTAPSDDAMAAMSAEMDDLKGMLIQSPEQQRKDELLAWGGGLTDPSGNGFISGALADATKAQSDHRFGDRKLRAMYVPLIMESLAKQQEAAMLARAQASAGTSEGISLIGMPIDQVPRYARQLGIKDSDALAQWKAANNPDTVAPGSLMRIPQADGTFKEQRVMDPSKPFEVGPNNEVSLAPGAARAHAGLTGATAYAETAAKKGFEPVNVMTADGVPGQALMPDVFPSAFQGASVNQPAQATRQTPAPTRAGMAAPAGGMQAPAPGRPTAGPNGNVLPPAGGNFRGNFQGNPNSIVQSIAAMTDPQEKANAMAAYENQLRGNNPAYVPDGAEPMAGAGAPPVDNSGLPPGAVRTGQSPAEKLGVETIKATNDSFIKTAYEPVLLAGEAGKSNLGTIAQTRQAIKGLGTTGWGTETKAKAASVLSALGVEKATDYTASFEQFQQAGALKLWEGLAEQKGPQTDGDANRMRETWARVGNTPKGNAFILDSAEALAQMKIRKAEYFQKALPLAQKRGDLSEISRRWSKLQPSLYEMPSMRKWDAEGGDNGR